MLNVHYALGTIVFLCALLAILFAPLRRVVQYLLALQIVVGAVLWAMLRVAPPPAHWLLAILIAGVYPMANAMGRRRRPKVAVMTVCAFAAVVIAYVIYLGMHAVTG